MTTTVLKDPKKKTKIMLCLPVITCQNRPMTRSITRHMESRRQQQHTTRKLAQKVINNSVEDASIILMMQLVTTKMSKEVVTQTKAEMKPNKSKK